MHEAALPALTDAHSRVVRYLRLSITDRCNLLCLYCRNGKPVHSIPHSDILRYEEMLRFVGIATRLGINKVRITGGEPFVRKGCTDFLVMLRKRWPSLDLRLTTNGTLLEPHVPLLTRLGVRAVNLSLDSFDSNGFAAITGRNMLPSVLASLDKLLAAGLRVKINVVAMRGFNDTQVDNFVHAAKTLPVDLRFIEFMPMGSGTMWGMENFWPAEEIREEVSRRARLTPIAENPLNAGPARMYALAGGKGRIGFITSMTDHFCRACNRLRLTSDGHARTCLFADKEYNMRGLLRARGITDQRILDALRRICALKPIGADILRRRIHARAVAERRMTSIGG
ncbi:MAG: GTP 3',8-cyclase MoaA [Desulfovibrio sp.]|jgi:cyclic pyranopterin phosphate synthase|nr:GTP 3',8-cyclase MoaA [Desulfovibrio sp.]